MTAGSGDRPRGAVLVTGGSRGIGRAIVLRLLDEGHQVALTWHRSESAARELEEEFGERILAVRADAREMASSADVVASVVERFGSLDGLVNNAGIRDDALTLNMSFEQWRDVVATNLDGVFAMTQAALGVLMRQRGGSIVTVTSLSGLHGVAGQANYAASKAGVIGMMRSIARECARSGIRVNCVAPGLVESDMTNDLAPELRKEMIRQIPMRRMISAEEVAAVVSFLLGSGASGITGQVVVVDGGASA